MRNLRTLICGVVLFGINSLHAQPFNPSVNVLSNTNGYVNFSSSNTVTSTGHFYLFDDGYFSHNDWPSHQFEANTLGFDTRVFFNKPYDPQPPTLRVTNTGSTGTGGISNQKLRITNNVLIGTSWLPVPKIENYFIFAFDNTSDVKEKGCVEFYFNSSELRLNSGGILDTYNNWVNKRSISAVTGSSLYDTKIEWQFTDLDINEQRIIYIPMESKMKVGSALNLGAKKNVNCSGGGSGGASSFRFNSNGSPHDPNTKSVYPECVLPNNSKQQELEYRIQFQNEGDAEAVNVVINDQLDMNFLDINTFEIIDSEYSNFTYTLNSNGYLTITFPNINLPGLNQVQPHTYTYDQTESYISFKICTREDLPPNECIDNMAEILFDTQPPIYTNTARSCADEECTLSIFCDTGAFLKNDSPGIATTLLEEVTIYPNPSSGIFMINNSSLYDSDVLIYNSLGVKVLETKSESKSSNSIDLNFLSNGIYQVQIYSNGQLNTRSIVKN